MVCSESMVVSVDMVELASMVEWMDEKVQGKARLVEVMMVVLVEIDDWATWLARRMDLDSSFFPSYKVQTGSLPTEVETEVAAYAENAESLIAWVHTIVEKTAGLDLVLVLVHVAPCGFVPALEIEIDQSPPWFTKRLRQVGSLRMQ